ncbi:CPCC family cysteine-rich protein [Streptomyces virginiae]|uniref:CPCC family cysteine-rich protein n=1 Tax=Streptomyces virginiae TaxID=1961 RepID=A0ABZ1TD22_STRVG|nr:CPCC family cysteine-rich protein [Streptomyces virginiae]WTB22774.1 CPCC family cysteine-rich protein [Streptomyces virginiae]
MSSRYPCPCCGHRGLDEIPGSYSICPVCFWRGYHPLLLPGKALPNDAAQGADRCGDGSPLRHCRLLHGRGRRQ